MRHLPNVAHGFGLAKVDNVLVTPTTFNNGLRTRVYGAWSDRCRACPKIGNGEEFTYKIEISDDRVGPLRVTLAWSDYPGPLSAKQALVEDLDLKIVGPRGTIWYPNGLDEPDRVNTAERIIVPNPSPGHTYTVTVRGARVTHGPQPFALVITGPLGSVSDDQPASATAGSMGGSDGGGGDISLLVLASICAGVLTMMVVGVVIARRGYYTKQRDGQDDTAPIVTFPDTINPVYVVDHHASRIPAAA